MEDAQPTFLDVPALLESSEPRPRLPWFWILVATFVGLAMASSGVAQKSPETRRAVEIFSGVVTLCLMGTMVMLSIMTVRTLRREQQAVESVAELVQLRRWQQAAFMLQQVLGNPARTQQLRAQALVYLAAVLSRYHRFEDAIAVQTVLLDEDLVDGPSSHGLKLGRAMAMLREDHLFDADRAISDLRRTPEAADSAGLALVEIYRDVKTGHPDDAQRLFEQKLPLIREQLGHRAADAYGLIARAYDLQGKTAEAADAWQRATLLAPALELCRRYPELEKLTDRYAPAAAPEELK